MNRKKKRHGELSVTLKKKVVLFSCSVHVHFTKIRVATHDHDLNRLFHQHRGLGRVRGHGQTSNGVHGVGVVSFFARFGTVHKNLE